MRTCQDLYDDLDRLPMDFAMQTAVERTTEEMVRLQKEQLQQGLKSDNSNLPDYSFRSVFQYGKPPGPILLYDTGAYYRGIGVDVREDIFIIESRDQKATMLKQRYGPDIMGLRDDALNEYILTLKPVFVNEVSSYLK